MVLRGELENRLDVPFYAPEIMELERKIRLKSNKKLSHFIEKMASGSTPSIQEEEKYYSNKENGIPFIRVQNLNPNNILSLDDLKYINNETHNNYLKRSQVFENDLLVKITGVGRMAVASIAPKDFIGNTNQHLVVIKTKDLETSEVLATFLNTDIGEKLATRRSTGGTRPALDYSALRSIPIVFLPEMVKIINDAVKYQQQKIAEAKAMLASIDDYLLKELGIILPEVSEKQKVFKVCSKKVRGGRFDPFYYGTEFDVLEKQINNCIYPINKLAFFLEQINYGASVKSEYEDKGIPFLRITDLNRNKIDIKEIKYLPEKMRKDIGNSFVLEDDFLITRSGTTGIVAKIPKEITGFAFGSFMIRFSVKSNTINLDYLSFYLNSSIIQKIVERNRIGAIQGNITIPTIKNFAIITPPISKQTEIAEYINTLRQTAATLEREAAEGLEKAKAEVERMILGEGGK